MSSMATAQHFAERNGLTGWPIRAQLKGFPESATSVDSLTWQGNGRPMCTFYTVKDGGHVIPQRAYHFPRLLGRTPSAPDAPREAIRFFEHNSFV